jgi:hypothetical protein
VAVVLSRRVRLGRILPITEAEAWGYNLEIDQRAPNDLGSILTL